MAKTNEYMAGREDGLQLALRIVKEKGIEGLEEEIRFRNITGIHTLLDKKSLDTATKKIKEMTIDTFTVLSVASCVWGRRCKDYRGFLCKQIR